MHGIPRSTATLHGPAAGTRACEAAHRSKVNAILEIPGIKAVQWVQGTGPYQEIMQWVPLIKKIQSAGKSVVVELQPSELETFMQAVDPKGIFLCIEADPDLQPDMIRKTEKWR